MVEQSKRIANYQATMTIYNISGQVITVLEDKFQQSGKHTITWNAKSLPSGLYFYTLKANELSETR